MINQSGVESRSETNGAVVSSSLTRVAPRANVYESAQGVELLLALPEVTPGDVDLRVEKGRLLVVARARLDAPKGAEIAHREFYGVEYVRSFQLTSDIDKEHIDARLEQGILKVSLPRRAEEKAKKVEVKAGV